MKLPLTSGTSVGIIAGQGQFPFLVARSVRDAGGRVAAIGFKGYTDPNLAAEVQAWCQIRLGQLNKAINFFKKNKVDALCFAGGINKPRALSLRPDWRAARLLLSALAKGDNALLSIVVAEFEKEGLHVVQAADLVPDLRAPAGVISLRKPSNEEIDDLRFGWKIGKTVGALDIGQCIVLKRGVVTAVEAIEGSDAAILRGGELAGGGAVIVKTVKPGQDERIDLPALGQRTIQTMIASKATCLGYEAGKSLFFDLDESLRLADKHDICIVGLNDPEQDL